MHFGVLPHDILAPLFEYPFVTFLVNVNYNLWFVVITAFFFWQGFRKQDTALRQQYLISYLLTWADRHLPAGHGPLLRRSLFLQLHRSRS